MDSALKLRIDQERGFSHTHQECIDLLSQSKLIQKLTSGFEEKHLFSIFRIMGLSEIPCSETLPYTQNLIDFINSCVATSEGFSYTGQLQEIVPCYNAMVLEAYTRLGLQHSREVQNALRWIKRYQSFDRNEQTTWPHKGICRHGGCLRATPCYIGIGKTVRALVSYSESINGTDPEVQAILERGISYMLHHQMFKRLSNSLPISKHITDLMFPQNYALSATDLAYIIAKQNLTEKEACSSFLHLLQEKQVSSMQWKLDYIYHYRGYVGFETRLNPSEWVSNLFAIWFPKLFF